MIGEPFDLDRPQLTLPCIRTPGDELRVGTYDASDQPLGVAVTTPGGDELIAILDDESARKLFNFLGVWLHKSP